jgi:hypothetical protein
MTKNKEFILKITDKDKDKRFAKILSCIKGKYEIQRMADYLSDVRNIILPAPNQENKITLMAHHDVYPGSFGYNDNSSGVVTLLKLQEDILPNNVEIVFTDGEEFGGRGSELYLNESVRPRIAINVDVVGLGNKIFYEKYGNGAVKVDGSKMEYYRHIPFSDSYILKAHNVPNVLLLTGYGSEALIRNIFEAQHNGPRDSVLDLIQEDIMDRVYDMVLDIIHRNLT